MRSWLPETLPARVLVERAALDGGYPRHRLRQRLLGPIAGSGPAFQQLLKVRQSQGVLAHIDLVPTGKVTDQPTFRGTDPVRPFLIVGPNQPGRMEHLERRRVALGRDAGRGCRDGVQHVEVGERAVAVQSELRALAE